MIAFSNSIKVLMILTLFLIYQNSYCQSDKKDSLAINLLKAVKITDSINSPLPDSIRNITIRDFQKFGLKPSEYYTISDLYIEKTNNLNESKTYKISSRKDFESLDSSAVTKDSKLIASLQNIEKVEIFWIIEYYKIGALKDKCFYFSNDTLISLGAFGEEGEDILVYYNSSFSRILKVENAE